MDYETQTDGEAQIGYISLTHEVSAPLATIVGQAHLIRREVSAGRVDPSFLLACTARIEAMAFRVKDVVSAREGLSPEGQQVVRAEHSPHHKPMRSQPETP